MSDSGDALYEKRFVRTRNAFAIAFALYFFIGISAEYLHFHTGTIQPPKMYPFFTWSMFARIPNETDTYAVFIEEFDGNRFDPPLHFVDSAQLIIGREQYSEATKRMIIEMARAYEAGNAVKLHELQENFNTIFTGKQFRYSIHRVTKEPIQFWLNREYKKNEVLTHFSSS